MNSSFDSLGSLPGKTFFAVDDTLLSGKNPYESIDAFVTEAHYLAMPTAFGGG